MKPFLCLGASLLAINSWAPAYAVTGQSPAAAIDINDVYSNVVLIMRRPDASRGETTPQPLCTGLLLNARTILTARHCVDPENYTENMEEGLKSGKFYIQGITDGITPDLSRQLAGISDAIQPKGAMQLADGITLNPDGSPTTTSIWLPKDDIIMLALDKPVDVPASAILLSPPQGDVLATMVGYGLSGTKEQARELATISAERSQIYQEATLRCGAACDPTDNGLSLSPELTAEEQARMEALDQRESAIKEEIKSDPIARRSGLNMFHVKTLADLRQEGFAPEGATNVDPTQQDAALQEAIAREPLPYLVADWDPSDPQAGEPDPYPNDTIPNEASPGPGDSGGPLFVTIGGKRFSLGIANGGEGNPINKVGGRIMYAALFNYYRWIVENTPYKYVAAVAGDGKWSDPAHWTQLLDPSWFRLNADGSASNGLPTHDVTRIDGTKEDRDMGHCGVLRGPGSTGFVPNNTDGSHGTEFENCAQYFDVTLAARGTTRLDMDATIDRLAINHVQARLVIDKAHSLTTLLDTRVTSGELRIEGVLKARNLINAGGLVSGSGTIRAATFTNSGTIAPGGIDSIGVLSLDGNLVLERASELYFDLSGALSDRLQVAGTAELGGMLSLNAISEPAYGQSYTLLTATGSLTGSFERTSGLSGVLKPVLTYDRSSPTKMVMLRIDAGRFRDLLPKSVSANLVATADAFDRARVGDYRAMRDFFGPLDRLEGPALVTALRSTQPTAQAAAPLVLFSGGGASGRMVRDRLVASLSDDRAQTPPGVDIAMAASSMEATDVARVALDLGASRRDLGKGWTSWLTIDRQGGDIAARQLSGSAGSSDAMSIVAGFDRDAGDDWVVGGFLGLDNRDLESGGLDQSWSLDAVLAGGHARRRMGNWAAAMWITRSAGDLKLSRTAQAGSVHQALSGVANTTLWTGGLAINRMPTRLGRLTLAPAASLELSRLAIDAYQESGGSMALQMAKLSTDAVTARFGGTASLDLAKGVRPFVSLTAVRDLGGEQALLQGRFAASAASTFRYKAPERDRAYGELQVGGSVQLGRKLNAELRYGRDVARADMENESLSMRLAYHF